MEVEVACRYNLPITFIVVNNNGIYRGIDKLPTDGQPIPSTAFIPNARYEKVMEAFGGVGYYVTDPKELKTALEATISGPEKDKPSLINIMITPEGPIPKIVQKEQKNEK